jgi:hypothetical protein
MARKVPRAKGVSARSEACPEPCWTPHGTHGPCRLPGPRIRSRPGVSRGGHHASPEQPSSWEMGHQNPNSQAGWPQSVCSMEFSRTWLQGDTSVTHGTLHHNPFCGTGV